MSENDSTGEERKLESGYYWVHLHYRLTVKEDYDGWEICRYDAYDDVWDECGTEIELNPVSIVEIDPKRLVRTGPTELKPLTCAVRFTRENSWPCEVKPDTPPENIETHIVSMTETRIKNGVRVYDMVCGHGIIITLPVHEETNPMNEVIYFGWVCGNRSDIPVLRQCGVCGEMTFKSDDLSLLVCIWRIVSNCLGFRNPLGVIEGCEATEVVMERLIKEWPGFWAGSFTGCGPPYGDDDQLPREQQKYWS